MKINELSSITAPFGNSDKMPVLFLGHGSPMNAIEENEFVTGFRTIGKDIQKPNAILCISAHWETRGTFVTAMDHPRTIHDFGGFPQALFDVQYPAPGRKDLANETKSIIKKTTVGLDEKWGLDHGAWSVIKHLYPNADIPVIQMSIDYTQPAQYHYELAQQLAQFRKKGVLIIGSGNMVHNLRLVTWDKLNKPSQNWIRKYLIGYSKEGLGRIWGKFSGDLQVPDSSIKLDYSSLLTEGKDERMKLVEELMARLERLRPDKILERKGNEAENLNKALKYRPMQSPYNII
jgi:4,5-DOPA dioxygenase extradiol